MNPVRTCVGCRKRADRSELVRVVARDGVVVPDPSESLSGRGAWLHPTFDCTSNAVARKAFGRALRSKDALDTTLVPDIAHQRNG